MTDKIKKFMNIENIKDEFEKELTLIQSRRFSLVEEIHELDDLEVPEKSTRLTLLKSRLNEIELTLKELYQLWERLFGLCYIPNIIKEDLLSDPT